MIWLYSKGRVYFMSIFYATSLNFTVKPINHPQYSRVLWGLKFASPIMNAAGMFKNLEGYTLVQRQGAGGYIGGTTTYNPRHGNCINNIHLPFLSLLQSNISLNCLGLPNKGDKILSQQVVMQNKTIPLGISLMRSADYDEKTGMEHLIESLWLYHNNLQYDFLEINESCPNIKVSADNIIQRLIYIGENFIFHRKRFIPVVIKVSVDISDKVLSDIMHILIKYKFDGINIGNTSIDYDNLRQYVNANDLKLFNYFVDNFGGGVGGTILKKMSYDKCKYAVMCKNDIQPQHEFHIIRSAGIDSIDDIYQSDLIGVSLNQWYTGYFSNFMKYGNQIYHKTFGTYYSNI